MSFKEVSFYEKNVVSCALKKRGEGKATPTSVSLLEEHQEHKEQMNDLNDLRLPGDPAIFWIKRGYQVYSTLTDDDYWFQYCLSDKAKEEIEKDISIYRKHFITYIEPSMCFVKGCHAYLTFDDDCEHTAHLGNIYDYC